MSTVLKFCFKYEYHFYLPNVLIFNDILLFKLLTLLLFGLKLKGCEASVYTVTLLSEQVLITQT